MSGMHTHYKQGTPLRLVMRSGEIVEGKFKDHKSGAILLEDGQKIALDKIRAVSIRKLKAEVGTESKKIIWRK